MKAPIFVCAIFCLIINGCVSINQYNKALIANVNQRKSIEKLNKKLTDLQRRYDALRDSISPETITTTPTVLHQATNTNVAIKTEAGIELSKDSFHTNTEKRILYYMNYARVRPRDFLKNCVLPNLSDTSGYYEKTLISTLRTMAPVSPLKSSHLMYQLAQCHAIESGKTGYVGHVRQKGCNAKGRYNAECCAYGNASYSSDPALNYVLQLLVDEGVPSLGHREIILMGWLKSAGISIEPHVSYGENVVIDFASY